MVVVQERMKGLLEATVQVVQVVKLKKDENSGDKQTQQLQTLLSQQGERKSMPAKKQSQKTKREKAKSVKVVVEDKNNIPEALVPPTFVETQIFTKETSILKSQPVGAFRYTSSTGLVALQYYVDPFGADLENFALSGLNIVDDEGVQRGISQKSDPEEWVRELHNCVHLPDKLMAREAKEHYED